MNDTGVSLMRQFRGWDLVILSYIQLFMVLDMALAGQGQQQRNGVYGGKKRQKQKKPT